MPERFRGALQLMIYAVSALFSFGVLTVGLRRLDPNRANTKKAAAHKKEIAQRLGRPSIQTNVYEDVRLLHPQAQLPAGRGSGGDNFKRGGSVLVGVLWVRERRPEGSVIQPVPSPQVASVGWDG